jgi:hypothetical protein
MDEAMEAIARLRTNASAATLALAGALGTSAGVHGGLFALHVADDRALALSFLAASLLLGGTALAVAFRPGAVTRALAAAVLTTLLVAYVVVAHDPFDALAAVTKTIEAGALLLALGSSRLERADDAGTPVGVLGLAIAAGLFLAGGHGH